MKISTICHKNEIYKYKHYPLIFIIQKYLKCIIVHILFHLLENLLDYRTRHTQCSHFRLGQIN